MFLGGHLPCWNAVLVYDLRHFSRSSIPKMSIIDRLKENVG